MSPTTDAGSLDAGSLHGKVAVVTGGTRGIGLATVECLAVAGATVVLTGRDETVVKARANEISGRTGARVAGAVLDLRDTASIGPVIKAIAAEFRRIDGFVANAGVLEGGVIGMLTEDHLRSMLEVNVAGTILSTQAAARVMMRKKAGAIVTVSSIVSRQGSAGQAVYAATKAAVATFALSAARELGRHGIRVNAVAPGVVRTDLIAEQDPKVLERIEHDTPLGRLGTTDEVATAIRFLLTDDASFITGQVLGVDGGLVL